MNRYKFICCLFFAIPLVINAQIDISKESFSTGNTVNDAFGNFSYQYNQIIMRDPNNPQRLLITIVFINGNSYYAINYRQESFNGKVEWLATDYGTYKKNGFVETVTALVEPGHIITWEYAFTLNKKSSKKNVITLDKAALLILNDNIKTKKIIFKEREYKVL